MSAINFAHIPLIIPYLSILGLEELSLKLAIDSRSQLYNNLPVAINHNSQNYSCDEEYSDI